MLDTEWLRHYHYGDWIVCLDTKCPDPVEGKLTFHLTSKHRKTDYPKAREDPPESTLAGSRNRQRKEIGSSWLD